MRLAASSFEVPDGLLATGRAAQLNPKPHQGLQSKNPAPHPAFDDANSTVAIGLRAGLLLNGLRQSERARYYGSALGRWTSPDWSAKPQPVPYAELTNPQTLNLYTYVQNNPLRGPDIDGHEDLYVMLDSGKVRNDITGQVSDLNKNGQMALGGIELGSAAISGGATLEAESIFSTVVGALTTSGLLASGGTRIAATAAGADPEKVEGAASAAQTVTNPIGLATTMVKGNIEAGAVAKDVSNAAAAVSNPKDAARDPAGTAVTVASVIQDVKAALSPASLPAPPKPPAPPKMCGSNACP